MTSSPSWVDSHAHLRDERFAADLSGVLRRAGESGVAQVVVVGTTVLDSVEGLTMAADQPGLFATVGVHPNHAAEAVPGDWERVVELARRPGVVGLGETGLDRHWDFTPFDLQREWFDRHLDLSEETGLPVVIHCRECEADVIDALRRRGKPTLGVLHSFCGAWEDAQAFLELGLYLSFAGMITYTNKKLAPLREVVARVPIDRILVETDSPYLSPHPHRGATNEPARVAVTGAKVAELRGQSVEALAAATTANARRLFGLPESSTIRP
ncbi:MAG: TatD family hydrolase [Isosphaeraceae bacterium]